MLHAVKEVRYSAEVVTRLTFRQVIFHSSLSQLEHLADVLWEPLFAEGTLKSNPKANGRSVPVSETGDDGVRNVKAACIGKLTTAVPAKYLPQLQVS